MNLQLVNKAIYSRLKTIKDITVADSIAVNAKRPYIVLTDATSTPWNSKTTKGFEVTAGVLLASDYKGDKEINELVGKVFDVLLPKLTLEGAYRVISQEIEEATVERVEDYREAVINIKLKIFKEETK